MKLRHIAVGLPFIGLLASPVLADEAATNADLQRLLALPSTIAYVTSARWTPSPNAPFPEFVLVQDVHKHPEVQSRIASVVLDAYQRWGARKVFIEGAFSTIDISAFQAIPDDSRALILNRLIQGGDLSGPELAAILLMQQDSASLRQDGFDSPFQLVGMEDSKVYKENLMAYQDVQRYKSGALRAVQRIRRMHRDMGFSKDSAIYKQLDRTELLVQLKMTPADYDDYLKAKAMTPASPELTPAVEAAERFYKTAQLRSHIFVRAAARKLPAATGPRLIVVGGFHTVDMAAELEKNHRSFVVLTPHISEPGLDTVYQKSLMESISALRIDSPFRGEMKDLTDVSKGVLLPSEGARRGAAVTKP